MCRFPFPAPAILSTHHTEQEHLSGRRLGQAGGRSSRYQHFLLLSKLLTVFWVHDYHVRQATENTLFVRVALGQRICPRLNTVPLEAPGERSLPTQWAEFFGFVHVFRVSMSLKVSRDTVRGAA